LAVGNDDPDELKGAKVKIYELTDRAPGASSANANASSGASGGGGAPTAASTSSSFFGGRRYAQLPVLFYV